MQFWWPWFLALVLCQHDDEDLQSLIIGEWEGTSFLSGYSTVSQIKCNFGKDGRFHDTCDTGTMSGSYTVNGSKVHIKCYSSKYSTYYERDETIVNGGLLGFN